MIKTVESQETTVLKSTSNLTEYGLIATLFGVLYVMQFVFREFLFYVAPFMPNMGSAMIYMELVGTFSIAGLEVVIPVLLYMTKVPMRTLFLTVTTALIWGGVILSFIYPTYSSSLPWVLASLFLAMLGILTVTLVMIQLRMKSLPIVPLAFLQYLSLVLYITNVLTEYLGLPLGGLSPYFVYPMLYLAGLGILTLLAYSLYRFKPSKWLITGYAVTAIIGFGMAYPMYSLTINNGFMEHIMDMVFAMGLGVLTTPASVPLVSVFIGLFIFATMALTINGILMRNNLQYMALTALVYITTAFTEHAIILYLAFTVVSSLMLIYKYSHL